MLAKSLRRLLLMLALGVAAVALDRVFLSPTKSCPSTL